MLFAIVSLQSTVTTQVFIISLFQVKSTQIHQSHGAVEQCYGLEVSGPILPHTKQRLLNLFSRTHKQFKVSLSVHMPSAPFNATADQSSECPEDPKHNEPSDELTDEKQQLKRPSHLGKNVIREMQYKDAVFVWVT